MRARKQDDHAGTNQPSTKRADNQKLVETDLIVAAAAEGQFEITDRCDAHQRLDEEWQSHVKQQEGRLPEHAETHALLA